MNVSAKVMVLAETARDRDHLLHGVVGIANYSGAEKQTLDIVSPVEIQRQFDDFVWLEARAGNSTRHAVDAVQAVVDAVVREQDLQQGNAPTIRRVTVANACARR